MTFVILDKKKSIARFVWRIGEVIDGGDTRFKLSHVRKGPLTLISGGVGRLGTLLIGLRFRPDRDPDNVC